MRKFGKRDAAPTLSTQSRDRVTRAPPLHARPDESVKLILIDDRQLAIIGDSILRQALEQAKFEIGRRFLNCSGNLSRTEFTGLVSIQLVVCCGDYASQW